MFLWALTWLWKDKIQYNTAQPYSMSAYSLSLLECLMNVWSSKCPKLNSWFRSPHTCSTHVLPHIAVAYLQPASYQTKALSHPLILSFYHGSYKIYQQILWVLPSYFVLFYSLQPVFSPNKLLSFPKPRKWLILFYSLERTWCIKGVFSTTWHYVCLLKMFSSSILFRVKP